MVNSFESWFLALDFPNQKQCLSVFCFICQVAQAFAQIRALPYFLYFFKIMKYNKHVEKYKK